MAGADELIAGYPLPDDLEWPVRLPAEVPSDTANGDTERPEEVATICRTVWEDGNLLDPQLRAFS